MRVLVSGSSGFVGRFITAELKARGHDVVTFDLTEGQDARDPDALGLALYGCDHFIAGAALCGGIGYLHSCPLGIIAENMRLAAASAQAAAAAFCTGYLKKITVISSSMVYEAATQFPLTEGMESRIPPPPSAYGFSKLAAEHAARAAFDQHGLPFTIVRPFNVTGPGDLTHVIPELARRVMDGQDPLTILGSGRQIRHFTWGPDLARGIVTAMEHPAAENEDFNLASPDGITVAGLAGLIWRKIRGDNPRIVSAEPYAHDVQVRVPSVAKARDLLGFEALTPLGDMLNQVIPWVAAQREAACA